MAIKQLRLPPSEVGINATTVANATEIASSVIDCRGYSQATVYIFLDYAASTRLDCNFDFSPVTKDDSASPTWYTSQTESISTGTVTLSDEDFQKAHGAADKYWRIPVPINDYSMRIRLTSTSGTSDTATVTVILGEL